MTGLVATVAEHTKGSGASVAILCRTLGLSRATFYGTLDPVTSPEKSETGLREAIQKTALGFPCYGYRRITAQLVRDGWRVNHKHVLRVMRQDNRRVRARLRSVCGSSGVSERRNVQISPTQLSQRGAEPKEPQTQRRKSSSSRRGIG
jgi:hypothetical protein